MELRSYQHAAVKAGLNILQGRSKINKGVLVLPSGSGKSVVIASIAKELHGNTIVFQPSKEILEQNLLKMQSFGYEPSVFSASVGRKEIGKITLATIGSIHKKKEYWNHFQNIIQDECHFSNAKGGMYEEFINHNGGRVLGLTATPYRLYSYNDMKTGQLSVVNKFLHRTRPRIFEGVEHVTQISDLYEGGFLCPLEYLENKTYDTSQLQLNSTGRDYTEDSLKSYHKKLNLLEMIVREIQLGESKHILVFTILVQEAEDLGEQLRGIGITAATISAKTEKKERERILSEFKSGKIKVVTNVGTLTTGYDFPELDCVILGRPTQSVALYYQMVGRAMRNSPGKLKSRIIDMCGNVKKFGRVETFKISGNGSSMRLHSESSALTGFDFYSRKDLEKTDYKNMQETEFSKPVSENILFGKFKGVHVSKVPKEYLEWCVKEFKKGQVYDMMVKELNRRH